MFIDNLSGNHLAQDGDSKYSKSWKCECGHTIQKIIYQCTNCLERYDEETDCCYDITKEITVCEKCGMEVK